MTHPENTTPVNPAQGVSGQDVRTVCEWLANHIGNISLMDWNPCANVLLQAADRLDALAPSQAMDERDTFEAWAIADNRDLAALEFEERTPTNNHYYAESSTNELYIGWCARAALTAAIGAGGDPRWQKLRDLFGLHGWHDGFWNGTPNPDQIVTHIGYIADERARLLKKSIGTHQQSAIGAGGQAVAVKPLEWWTASTGDIISDSLVGRYRLGKIAANENYRLETPCGLMEKPSPDYYWPEQEAKAAAQADFERRILSALSNPPAQPGWRLIERGETIEADDEVIADNAMSWVKVDRWAVGVHYSGTFKSIRRALPAAPLPGGAGE